MYKNDQKGPKRGVALYSYSAEFGFEKTLEDCFEDLCDMGAHGIEILANTHIENYPYPTDEWVDKWFRLCDKYQVEPVEYGHWIDVRVLQDRNLTTEEAIERLEQDMRLAHRLGFHVLRTKMSVINDALDPVENWRDIIRGVLPLAEKLDLKLCPEIHIPTSLKSQMIKDYVDFIKETGTKNFGLNIDFSVFRKTFREGEFVSPGFVPSEPEDLIPLIPYIYCCHAKFFEVNEDFEETMVPYKEILTILKDNGWDGYLLSEYEGNDKYDQGYEVGQVLRRHHIMMKRILGQ
ncbi:Sugar phosphate isomerase/epimerase [Lachnospiraceae bacterium]|nr:Sugar phosphate isomerase/epimerase [Lachnospiraceae bacterium]